MIDQLLVVDALARDWLTSLPHPAALDFLMLTASAIGRRGAVWIALAFGLAIRRPRLAGGVWQLILTLIFVGALVDLIVKPAVARPRPFATVVDLRVVGERPPTFSFPSGHAAEAFAGAFVVSRLWRRARRTFWLLAILIAVSRVYVGVHYPLDIVAGAALGLACAVFVTGGTVWDEEGISGP